MLKKIVEYCVAYLIKFSLLFRYKIKVIGYEKLNSKNLKASGGILFLPNHPAVFVDPSAVTLAVWPKFPIRPMIVEYMYYLPFVHWLMKFMDALPIPSFATATNTLKRKKSEEVLQTVIENLRKGQNFMIYPAGKLKNGSMESLGGASGVHKVIQNVSNVNIVLVRTKGLWGSSFSKAFTGVTPPLFPTLWNGIKIVFKNLLFFTPKREIIIELEPAPDDFPYHGTRLEMNRYLEAWYNRPDGLTKQEGKSPGDSLVLVPYSIWSNEKPQALQSLEKKDMAIDVSTVSPDIHQKVVDQLGVMSDIDPAKITPQMTISSDLGLDSLDTAELAVFLHDQFDIKHVPVSELTTVGKVLAIASKQIVCKAEAIESSVDLAKWKKPISEERCTIPKGETIPEVFLNTCEKYSKRAACVDARSGVLTYQDLKMRAILLAHYIQSLPGKYIGILLPASTAASACILACQLAGKIPLMVNWTVGSRHLESVSTLSHVEIILSSWAFLDRLEGVDLTPIEDKLIMLEDARRNFGIKQKIKAYLLSKRKTADILKTFNPKKLQGTDIAVLLFTSGTESLPKGVPLSHANILFNHRAIISEIDVKTTDVLYGILPPFHSFGFTVSTFLGLLCGIRTAYYPDPTDGFRLAKGFEEWGITIMCGAPTFIRGMLKAANPKQLTSMRLCVTGAEKAPQELFQKVDELGQGRYLLEGYGVTECAPIISFNRQGRPPAGVGPAMPGVDLLIVHPETYEKVAAGQQGLILVHGPNVFDGYLNPGLDSPFIELDGKKWYKTGDLGYLDEENNLYISGRAKRFIKLGGEMISLTAIEDALLQMAPKKGWPLIEEGPTLAICAKETVDKPKVYLFTRFIVSADEVNLALKEAGFSNLVKVSSTFHLDDIPLMGTGKVNYRLLENRYLSAKS